MKKYIYYLFLFFLFSLTLYHVEANNNVILNGIKIYIDPGHGGIG